IILIGALIRSLVERSSKSNKEKEVKVANGISLSYGLVAGGSIIGLVGIILQVTGVIKGTGPSGFANSNSMAFIILAALVITTIIPIVNSKVKDA
ncbi:MAG: peptide transporter, partial [Bacillota bacterium]|nr:peptide transporter [Bacillota bacterium]